MPHAPWRSRRRVPLALTATTLSSLALPSLALPSLALPSLALSSLATAQQALFWRDQNLAPVAPWHGSVAAAIQHLCAGPSAGEIAAGYRSRLPAGTSLLACQQQGANLRLVFDPTLLTAATQGGIEDAIEQIDKTAFGDASVRSITIAIRQPDGSEPLLGELLGHPPQALPQPRPSGSPIGSLVAPFGALTGKRIAVSPGHGYYWHSTLGWTTQRGVIDGLLEDIHTAEICNQYLIPFLENLGADVVDCREHGELASEALVDNDGGAPGYVETGSWTTSTSSGYGGGGYRFVSSAAVATATATWTLPVPQDGLYPVYAWFRASSNRTTAAHFTVAHAGGSSSVTVDQTRDNLSWAWLGDFWFTTAQGAVVTLDNQSASPGVCIADTIRLGGGMGSIARGAGTSGQRRWRECARYWSQFAGAPSTVWDSISGGEDNDDDVTARPRFAEWRGADAFVSLHTNAGGGGGTSTYIYNGGATAGSATLSQAVHTQIVGDLQAYWNSGWTDRGQLQANFGEVRLLSTMPGILVELAFHDVPGSLDHTSLHDPEFRYLSARAYARGVLRYFAPTAPFPPEPPNALRVVQDGAHGLLVAWDPAAGAASYTVEQSLDGKGFVQVASVTGTNWSTGPLPHHSLRSFRVRAWNATGRSFPTEVLTAGTDHLGTATALLVQGFDRLDRYVKGPDNTRDYLRLFGDGLRRDANYSLGFDAATNEAVRLLRVGLPNYAAVVWSLGEESTADQTFDSLEQALVQAYLGGGGSLLVSGAEVAWDLDAQGSAADRAFYRNQLGATYVADDANTHLLQAGLPGTVSAGEPAASFDDGTHGTYDVDYPDVLAPTDANSTICLRYGNGLTAGIQRIVPATGARTVVFGLPLETIVDPATRAQLLRQSLAFLLPDLPVQAPATAVLGTNLPMTLRLPGEAGQQFLFCMSEGFSPGTPLPAGKLLPLNFGFLLELSLQPSPFLVDFQGTLDGNGFAAPQMFVPYLPFLAGLPLYFAALTFDPNGPVERQVTNWVRVVLTL